MLVEVLYCVTFEGNTEEYFAGFSSRLCQEKY